MHLPSLSLFASIYNIPPFTLNLYFPLSPSPLLCSPHTYLHPIFHFPYPYLVSISSPLAPISLPFPLSSLQFSATHILHEMYTSHVQPLHKPQKSLQILRHSIYKSRTFPTRFLQELHQSYMFNTTACTCCKHLGAKGQLAKHSFISSTHRQCILNICSSLTLLTPFPTINPFQAYSSGFNPHETMEAKITPV